MLNRKHLQNCYTVTDADELKSGESVNKNDTFQRDYYIN